MTHRLAALVLASAWSLGSLSALGLAGCRTAGSSGPGPAYGPGLAYGPGPAAAPQGSPDELVELALRAAAAGDFDGYLALVHSGEKSNAIQVTNIREFSWKRFSQQASWYRDPSGRVQIDRREPQGADWMLFVHDFRNQGRLPPPLRVRPDGGAWRIVTNSL